MSVTVQHCLSTDVMVLSTASRGMYAPKLAACSLCLTLEHNRTQAQHHKAKACCYQELAAHPKLASTASQHT